MPPTPRGTRRRTSPTSRHRSRPTRRARPSLRKMVRHYGLPTVRAYMGHVQDNAAEAVSRVIAKLKTSRFEVETDQGSVIKVAIKIDKKARKATVDFTGTSAQVANAFNAPEPITRACVLYVFRTLVDEEIPLNAGCLRPIKIVVPKGSMLKPRYPAAGCRRQCGDQPDHRQLSLWRARRARLGARHDEQSHLRQRGLSILRDDLLGRAGRRRLRRRGRGANAYDQFAPHRSRGAGAALPRAAGALRDRARLRRQRTSGAPATGRFVSFDFWKKWSARSCRASAS